MPSTTMRLTVRLLSSVVITVYVVVAPLLTQAFLLTSPHVRSFATTTRRRCPETIVSWGYTQKRRRDYYYYYCTTRIWNSDNPQNHHQQVVSVPPLPLEITLTDGTVVSLEVSDGSSDDGGNGGGGVESCISNIVSKIGTQTQDGPESLASLLMSYWQQHVQTFQEFYHPQIYNGPVAYDDDQPSSQSSYESTVRSRIELPSGLVLEVGQSTIPNAGLGLFLRKQSPTTSDDGILQTIGSAFAGYSSGGIIRTLEGCSTYQTSRAFEFRLDEQLRSTVWYGSKILTIDEALVESGATSVAGHHLMFEDDDDNSQDNSDGNTGVRRRLVGIVPDDDDRFYFVPDDPSSSSLSSTKKNGDNDDNNNVSIQTVGHFVNDLAGGSVAKNVEEYDTLSDLRNILVLVPRVHAVPVVDEDGKDKKDSKDGDTIKQLEMAGMPLLTLSKNIVVDNTTPMEIGLKYGYNYWNP
mmetsp:Transcript_2638/g.5699  ORF Transcript_2638/g.5699 Transcript_2638/m.5699 type:complete len:465 (+) Transcript_2638:278-1672(+)